MRAERFPPEHVAQACDQALDTGGELVRLWQLADAERRRAGDDVARPAPDVAKSASDIDPYPRIRRDPEGSSPSWLR